MSQPPQDRWYVEEALQQLQEYLLGEELYWALGRNLPRLTPGNLLLALKRLEAVDPHSAWTLREKLDAIQARWRSAWEKKIARETESRLRLWSQFLTEQAHDESPSRAHYAASVRERVILQLLKCSAPQLAELDALLRARFQPGGFVWDAMYQSVFPKSEFWFLYGSL
ncbi:MAG: hypothetical protein Fur0016_25670 [Anaerolineales bacterium]